MCMQDLCVTVKAERTLLHRGGLIKLSSHLSSVLGWMLECLVTWETTKQNGRLRDVLRTMKEEGIDMLALSEVRWPGHGIIKLCGTTHS